MGIVWKNIHMFYLKLTNHKQYYIDRLYNINLNI